MKIIEISRFRNSIQADTFINGEYDGTLFNMSLNQVLEYAAVNNYEVIYCI